MSLCVRSDNGVVCIPSLIKKTITLPTLSTSVVSLPTPNVQYTDRTYGGLYAETPTWITEEPLPVDCLFHFDFSYNQKGAATNAEGTTIQVGVIDSLADIVTAGNSLWHLSHVGRTEILTYPVRKGQYAWVTFGMTKANYLATASKVTWTVFNFRYMPFDTVDIYTFETANPV